MDSGSSAKKSDNRSICTITGLPVYSPEKWNNIRIDDKFRISFLGAGKNILVVKPSGKITFENYEYLIPQFNVVIREMFDADEDIIILEDLKELHETNEAAGTRACARSLARPGNGL